jgi:hypothetical protein
MGAAPEEIELARRRECVLDRLADLLLDADELLAILGYEDAVKVRWIEPHVRRAFDEVDAAMRGMTD